MKKTYFYLVLTAILFAPFMMNGQNLVTNGDFEQWDNATTPTGWTVTGMSDETTIVHGGSHSAAHTSATNYRKCLQKVNVTAGNDYTISFWYYDSSATAKIKLKTIWLNGAANIGDNLVDFNPNDNSWHKYSAIITAPANATKIKIDLRTLSDNGTGGKVFFDDVYFGSVVTEPEPDNHVTNFTAAEHALSYSLAWDDAIGTTLPSGYLIIGARNGATIVDPTDLTPIADDLDWSDDLVAFNIPYGYLRKDFTNLDSSMNYEFKIYPYSNAISYIDYKVDGTVPSVTFTTNSYALINSEGFESNTSGTWTAFDVSGTSTWAFPTFKGRSAAKMASTNEVNEDWLISPALDLTGFDTVRFAFENTKKGTGDSLRLFVSTNYSGSGDPTTATWTNLTSKANWATGNYELEYTDSLDLTAYVGQTIYLAFKYTSGATDDMIYKIDNLQTYAVFTTATTPDAIQDIKKARVAIYPNPAENNFFLKTGKAGTVTLLDAMGREVLKDNLETGVNNIELNNINKGVYIAHIVLEDGSESVTKLVVR